MSSNPDLYNKEEIIKILMRRDNISKEEAWTLVNEVQEEINECVESEDFYEIDDIVMRDLGLKPDYALCFVERLLCIKKTKQ